MKPSLKTNQQRVRDSLNAIAFSLLLTLGALLMALFRAI